LPEFLLISASYLKGLYEGSNKEVSAMRSKVSMIGAGNVGATCAFRIAEKGYLDVVLVDIIEGLPQGRGLDMLEVTPIIDSDVKITGTNDYEETAVQILWSSLRGYHVNRG